MLILITRSEKRFCNSDKHLFEINITHLNTIGNKYGNI